MTREYLETLYQDFETKQNSIKVYLERIGNEAKDVDETTKEWATLLKRKNDSIEAFNKSRPKSVPTTQFSIESLPDSGQIDSSAEKSIHDIDLAINNNSQQINYQFTKAQRDLQFLVTSFQDLQNLVNQIYEAWSEVIEMKE